MTEERRLTENEILYSDAVYEGHAALQNAMKAFDELMDYYWDVDLSAKDALNYTKTPIPLREHQCTVAEKVSHKVISEYGRIMWFINIARDYCFICSEELKKVLDLC